MKNIYVTGSNGFLGSKIINYLSSENIFDAIFAISRNLVADTNTSTVKNISYDEFYNQNGIKSEGGLLLHLAFARSYDQDSIMQSIRLLENVSSKAEELGLTTIINVSSQSIYDQYRTKKAEETDLPLPLGLYGLAKYYSEAYLDSFSKKNKIKIINLRLASLIGPGLDQRIIPRLIKSAIEDGIMNITSNKERFSFLHVDDAARMISEIAFNSDKAYELPYNVGIDESYSLVEISKSIINKLQKFHINDPNVSIEISTGKQFNSSLSVDKLERDFSISANISMEEIIEMEIVRYLNER